MEGCDETGVMQRMPSSFGIDNQMRNSSHERSNYQLGIDGQMRNLSVMEGTNVNVGSYGGKRPVGIPPSHPHSSFVSLKIAPHHVGERERERESVNPTHSRSFSFDHLPPLSPSVFRESGGLVSGLSEVLMEERKGGDGVHVSEGLPPRRGHRRSNSDVPLGFASMGQVPVAQFVTKEKEREKPSQLVLKREVDWGGPGDGAGERGGERKFEGEMVDDLFSAYMSLDNLDVLNSSSLDDKDMDSRASGTRTNYSSENEVESSIAGNSHGNSARKRGKRNSPGEIAPTGRHFRSLSMDSFMGGLNFGEESPKLPPSPGIRSVQHSPSNSLDENTNKFSLEINNSDFSPAELKKIMASENLAEIAVSDPKRVKRILANRQSAARSKERKMRYIAELEQKVQTLQIEATTLSAQLTSLQRDSTGLTNLNNELKFRLQAMEQEAQLRDALNEALKAEVQHLKLLSAELRGDAPNCSPQQIMSNSQMLQFQPSQYMYQLQQNNQNQHKAPPQQENQEPKQSQPTRSQKEAEASNN